MNPNPYEPASLPRDERTVAARLLDVAKGPTPVRTIPEQPMRWVVDSLIAFVLCIAGFLVAGLVREALPLPGAMAYGTALPIGLFPAGMWMHYCGVGRNSAVSNALLVTGLMCIYAYRIGVVGFTFLPASLAVLGVALPIEWVLGKLVLSWLPGSRG